MKKVLAIMLSAIIAVNLAGCGKKDQAAENVTTGQPTEMTTTNDPQNTESAPAETPAVTENNTQNTEQATEEGAAESKPSTTVPAPPETTQTITSKPAAPSTAKPAPPAATKPVTSTGGADSKPQTTTPVPSVPESTTAATPGKVTVNSPLADIIDACMEQVKNPPAVSSMELNDENFKFFAFIDPVKGAEGVASDAMIGSIAHSVVLLRFPGEKEAANAASQIEKNANPAKWICVSAEKTVVLRHKNLVMLVMSFEDCANDIETAFNSMF